MTVHKLTAGDGYTYLTRQVASHDERRDRGHDLAGYYTASGNPPGRWLGSGADDIGVTGLVSEAQMKALFGRGLHPVTEVALGRAFPAYDAASTRHAVAGYDLVFTPVKSASILWALGDHQTRRAVEDAHHEAVADVLAWLERHAAFTRTGPNGEAQIDTHGLIAAAFDHRDSRLGDPDLHAHVAVSNKVRGVDGKWRSLDGRALHHVGVAASERYNTRFEDALVRRLGVRFAERADTVDRARRPVREIDRVPLPLIKHFSRRRQVIEARYVDLLADYRRAHGKTPPRSTQLRSAQQATLDTREGKKAARPLAEQLAAWRADAETVLGANRVLRMLERALTPPTVAPLSPPIETIGHRVLDVIQEQRATWSRWNVAAEAERAVRGFPAPTPADRDALVDAVVTSAIEQSIAMPTPVPMHLPNVLRRSDRVSVFVPHASERYTTAQILAAEQRLLARARVSTRRLYNEAAVDQALDAWQRQTGRRLDDGQRRVVRDFATDPRPVRLGIGPAGSGKTTAMSALAHVLTAQGRRFVPLATSAKAAAVLGTEIRTHAENLHKFVAELDRNNGDEFFRLDQRTMVLVDEIGMAGTLLTNRLAAHADRAGAVVRGLGDPCQLGSVEAGGWVRLVAQEAGAAELTVLHRFSDPEKARASLLIRDGDPVGLQYFEQRSAIRSGTLDEMVDAAYAGWLCDVQSGRTSIMTAARLVDVAALSTRARVDRVAAGDVEPDGVELPDGNRAGVGDWVVSRRNDRILAARGGRDFVKNGDVWTVLERGGDGGLVVGHHHHLGRVRLPAAYVARHVELAYAMTAHRAQGITVDEHPIITPELGREAFYVMTTRARSETTLYVATDAMLEVDVEHGPQAGRGPRDVLAAVLANEQSEAAATRVGERLAPTLEWAALSGPQRLSRTLLSASATFPTLDK